MDMERLRRFNYYNITGMHRWKFRAQAIDQFNISCAHAQSMHDGMASYGSVHPKHGDALSAQFSLFVDLCHRLFVLVAACGTPHFLPILLFFFYF